MDPLLLVSRDALLVFLLVVTRVSGLVVSAPLYGRSVPVRVRLLLAVAAALLVTPLHLPLAEPAPATPLGLLVVLAQEFTLGLAHGLAILILVAGLQLSGQLIGQLSGMQMADVFHSELNTQVPVLSQLLDLITLAVFLIIGGHRQVMAALLDSFHWMPPGQAVITDDLVTALAEIARRSFELGLRAAAPVVVSLLVSMLVLGLISRTLPQLNVLAVGFGVNLLVMLAALLLSLGAMVLVFQEYAGLALQQVQQAVSQPPGNL